MRVCVCLILFCGGWAEKNKVLNKNKQLFLMEKIIVKPTVLFFAQVTPITRCGIKHTENAFLQKCKISVST